MKKERKKSKEGWDVVTFYFLCSLSFLVEADSPWSVLSFCHLSIFAHPNPIVWTPHPPSTTPTHRNAPCCYAPLYIELDVPYVGYQPNLI